MSSLNTTRVSDFYQRHEHKIILVVVALLSIYLLAFAARITWSLLPKPSTQINLVETQLQPEIISKSSQSRNSVSNITKLNLFGNAQAQPVIAQQVDEKSDVPETKLNLVLSGVVSSSDEERGAAIIEYRNVQSTYGVGDKVEGTNVTLDQIYIDRVIIKNSLNRETLMLEGIDFEEANRNKDQQPTISVLNDNTLSPTNSLAQNQDMRSAANALRQVRQQISQEPTSFSDLISLAPHRVEDELIGFRVSPGAKPALFNSIGLKNGDVVVQLNGLDLSDIQQSAEAISQLQDAEFLLLEVLRGGEYVSLELEIPDESGNP